MAKVKEYLAKFTKDNPFDLEGMTIDKKISDVLEKLRKNLKNQFGKESSRITISMYNVNNTIQSDGLLKLDENYKAVIFKVGTFSKEIRVYFNNFQNISDFLNKIIEKDVNFFDEIVDIDYSNNKEDDLINAKKIANFYKNKFGWKVKVGFTYRLKNFVISLDDYHFKFTKFLDDTFVVPINKSVIEDQDFIKVFG
ncbi:SIMPL domain-containing protein [Spiroplasma endosymbiont of Lonchoptera lutea]|uniref:SIMPL domain-containing protein n=1 Tax=Spiroplasma endosymbiont of Lonchoptera lutea TaxID=3066297 RepID=UPI0030D4FBB1